MFNHYIIISTKHKVLGCFSNFSHCTHIKLCILIKIFRNNNNFKFHWLGKEIIKRKCINLWLICLYKLNLY